MNPRLKKIGRNLLFLISIPVIIGAFVFANSNNQQVVCNGIKVDIQQTALSFVTIEDVLSIIEDNGVKVKESILSQIAIDQLEGAIKENRWVKAAEIYVAANQMLNVKVEQKIPVVRINTTDSSDYAYYLDEYANPIELSDKYSAKVPAVTSPSLGYTRKDLKMKHELVSLAKYIAADTLWNKFITQINVSPAYQLELIPALGDQVILIGNVEQLDNKMKRLLAFYQQGMHTVDWSKYNQIDLRFQRQVIGRNTQLSAFPELTLKEEENKITLDHKNNSNIKAVPKKQVIANERKPSKAHSAMIEKRQVVIQSPKKDTDHRKKIEKKINK